MKSLLIALVLVSASWSEAASNEKQRVSCMQAFVQFAQNTAAAEIDLKAEPLERVFPDDVSDSYRYNWNGKRIIRTPVRKRLLWGYKVAGRPEVIWDQERFDTRGDGRLRVNISSTAITAAQSAVITAIFEARQYDNHIMTLPGRSNRIEREVIVGTYQYLESCTALRDISFDGRENSIGEESVRVREALKDLHSDLPNPILQ